MGSTLNIGSGFRFLQRRISTFNPVDTDLRYFPKNARVSKPPPGKQPLYSKSRDFGPYILRKR